MAFFPRLFYQYLTDLLYEPEREETYLLTCASSEDSDQPAHSHSLIRIFPGFIFEKLRMQSLFMRTTTTDQIAWMRCLI